MKCPPCKGTGKSPSNTVTPCLCCKGKKEITQTHFDTLKIIASDLKAKLREKSIKANAINFVQSDYVRPVTPYTLVVNEDTIHRLAIKDEGILSRINNAGGIIFEDWETAEKVAYGLTLADGKTLAKVKGVKGELYVPNDIPDWVEIGNRMC